MKGRTVKSAPEGCDNNSYQTYFARLTASTDSDLYWSSKDILEEDEETYHDNNDQTSSLHIENTEILARETRFTQQPSTYIQPRYYATMSVASNSPILHTRDPMTYKRRAPVDNSADISRRQPRRRSVAREPQRHLSSIDEESASTVFPYTIQGSGQTTIHPLPPIPAGEEQQELPAQSYGTQRKEILVSTGYWIQQGHNVEIRDTHVSQLIHGGIGRAMTQVNLL